MGRGGTLVSWAVTEEHWVKGNKIAHLVQVGTKRAAKGSRTCRWRPSSSPSREHKQALDLVSAPAR